jgi:hypothetical protein
MTLAPSESAAPSSARGRLSRTARLARRASVLAALALVVPTAAHAAGRTYDDARGDITTFKTPPRGTNPAKSNGIDIHRVTISQRDFTGTIRVQLRDVVLGQAGAQVYQQVDLAATFRRPGATRDTTQRAYQGVYQGIQLAPDCQLVDSSFSASADTVTFTYPRSCFGGARTVTFSVSSSLKGSQVFRRDTLYAGYRF